MKKSNFLKLVIITLVVLINTSDILAQGPPPWAPAHGFRAKTRHIYFPEQNFYYDVQKHNYIYLSDNNWEISVSLPSIFVGVNLGNVVQVELDFTGNNPYRYNEVHIVKYKKEKKFKKQKHKKNKTKYND